MNQLYLRRLGIECALALMLFGCANRADQPSNAVLDSLTKQHVCRPTTVRITAASEDSLTSEQRCALVLAALKKIANQSDGEILQSDTSAIASARVTSLAFTDTAGRSAEAYWAVDFELSNRPYDAVVHIDQRTGGMTAAKAHKKF